MATSGTVSTTTFNTRQVVDRAFGRCKLRPQQISSEDLSIAQQNLYLLLSALANKGVQLWCVEKIIVPLYEGLANVTLPLGTVDILNANYRSLTRLEGTYSTSAGGDADLAFDNDFDTACVQTSADGNISVEFDTATQVTTVGLLPDATAALDLVFERSDDGLVWTQVDATGEVAATDEEWLWWDIDGNEAALYFRVRETGGATLTARELFIGNTPLEIPLGRLNQDDYTAFPNKTFQGQPLQYWLDRARDQPVMNTWPVCSNAYRYSQFTVWRQRYIQDVGTLTESLDIPQRWFDAIVDDLAWRTARDHPEVPDERMAVLRALAAESYNAAYAEERDNSPMRLAPAITAYTR